MKFATCESLPFGPLGPRFGAVFSSRIWFTLLIAALRLLVGPSSLLVSASSAFSFAFVRRFSRCLDARLARLAAACCC